MCFEQDNKEDSIIQREEHLHFWHISDGLQTTRGQEEDCAFKYQSAQINRAPMTCLQVWHKHKTRFWGSTSAQHILKAPCIVIKYD